MFFSLVPSSPGPSSLELFIGGPPIVILLPSLSFSFSAFLPSQVREAPRAWPTSSPRAFGGGGGGEKRDPVEVCFAPLPLSPLPYSVGTRGQNNPWRRAASPPPLPHRRGGLSEACSGTHFGGSLRGSRQGVRSCAGERRDAAMAPFCPKVWKCPPSPLAEAGRGRPSSSS